MVSNEIYERIVSVKNAIAEGKLDDVIYEQNCNIAESLRRLLSANNMNFNSRPHKEVDNSDWYFILYSTQTACLNSV